MAASLPGGVFEKDMARTVEDDQVATIDSVQPGLKLSLPLP
jgi:hypothetical protein